MIFTERFLHEATLESLAHSFLYKRIANGDTLFKFDSGHLIHAFAIKKPKNKTPKKNSKPENITEEIREREAEKIAEQN